MSIDELVATTLDEYINEPTGLDSFQNETRYIFEHLDRYRFTLCDIIALTRDHLDTAARILDISSYSSFLPVALARAGYNVTVTDVPAVMQCAGLITKLDKFRIDYASSELHNELPFTDNSFDLISCCETLEHLNFNPVIALRHIYRVLKPGGILYLTVPSASQLRNLLLLAQGKQDDSFIELFASRQTDGTFPVQSIGVHWHEYTSREATRILSAAGFRTTRVSFRNNPGNYPVLKRVVISSIIRCFPHLSSTIALVALKERSTEA